MGHVHIVQFTFLAFRCCPTVGAWTTTKQIVPWFCVRHPDQMLREKEFSIVRRERLYTCEGQFVLGSTSLCGDAVDACKLCVVEEHHRTCTCRGDLFPGSFLGCHSNQPALVSNGEVEPCRTSEVEVVSQGSSHSTIAKVSQHEMKGFKARFASPGKTFIQLVGRIGIWLCCIAHLFQWERILCASGLLFAFFNRGLCFWSEQCVATDRILSASRRTCVRISGCRTFESVKPIIKHGTQSVGGTHLFPQTLSATLLKGLCLFKVHDILVGAFCRQ